jgi:hypothetical protein
MELIRARTSVPIPKIFGYQVGDDNIARAVFTLLAFLPGCSAMDAMEVMKFIDHRSSRMTNESCMARNR